MSQNKKEFPKDATILQTTIQQGIDLQHRRIYFGDLEYVEGSEIEFCSIELTLRAIDKMLDINNKPIEIYMSSYGGDPYAMLALHDKIQESPCKFIFFGRGMIMSSATWVMCCCDERYLSTNTTVLVHDGFTDVVDRSTDARINSDENERLQQRLAKIYEDNSYLDRKFWSTVGRRDLYLTAEETIKLGLADKITPFRKRGLFRKGPREHTFLSKPDTESMRGFISELFKRIKAEVPQNLQIVANIDEFEEIDNYDNSDKELEHLGLKKIVATNE